MAKLYWTKRIGSSHIMGGSTTLCGKPMLGNNYSLKGYKKPEDREECKECKKIYDDTKT